MTVQAVRKAVDVLFAIAESDQAPSLTEIAAKTGIPVPTASRLLATLTEAALIVKKRKAYALGIRAFEVGKRAERGLDIIELARPHLRALADRTGENANLAVLDGIDVVYLACEECSKMVRAFTVQGARVPAHATGVGKVLLSGLDVAAIERLYGATALRRFTSRTVTSLGDLLQEVARVREAGFALDEGEKEAGVLCIAAPVRDYAGRVMAAVSVSGPTSRLGRHRAVCQKDTLECAKALSIDLGWTGASITRDTPKDRERGMLS